MTTQTVRDAFTALTAVLGIGSVLSQPQPSTDALYLRCLVCLLMAAIIWFLLDIAGDWETETRARLGRED